MNDLHFLPNVDVDVTNLPPLKSREVAVLLAIEVTVRRAGPLVSYVEVLRLTGMVPRQVDMAVRSLIAARLLQAFKPVSLDSDSEGKRRARPNRRK